MIVLKGEINMDLVQIGKFIQECRKSKNLTQVQLAQKIGVSEKTISKWECGNGFPDTTLMLPLCKVLDITANELLSGKLLLSENEYKKIAEQNIIALKSQQEKSNKHLLTLEFVVGYMSSITFIIMIFIASFCNIATGLRIGLILLGFIDFIIGVHFCLKIETEVGFYQCKNCKYKYIPTYKQVVWSMHYGRTRYMKCPKCNKRSWNKKVINED